MNERQSIQWFQNNLVKKLSRYKKGDFLMTVICDEHSIKDLYMSQFLADVYEDYHSTFTYSIFNEKEVEDLRSNQNKVISFEDLYHHFLTLDPRDPYTGIAKMIIKDLSKNRDPRERNYFADDGYSGKIVSCPEALPSDFKLGNSLI